MPGPVRLIRIIRVSGWWNIPRNRLLIWSWKIIKTRRYTFWLRWCVHEKDITKNFLSRSARRVIYMCVLTVKCVRLRTVWSSIGIRITTLRWLLISWLWATRTTSVWNKALPQLCVRVKAYWWCLIFKTKTYGITASGWCVPLPGCLIRNRLRTTSLSTLRKALVPSAKDWGLWIKSILKR